VCNTPHYVLTPDSREVGVCVTEMAVAYPKTLPGLDPSESQPAWYAVRVRSNAEKMVHEGLGLYFLPFRCRKAASHPHRDRRHRYRLFKPGPHRCGRELSPTGARTRFSFWPEDGLAHAIAPEPH
jgi:hypothetical protein